MSNKLPKKPRRAPPQTVPDRQLRLEKVPTGSLTAMAGHARTLTRKHVKQIHDFIQRVGYINPIVVDEDGQILAGHVRWKAAKQLGLKEVPVVRAFGMTIAEKRAYRLGDNKLTELGQWDTDTLGEEFEFLLGEEFELELTGFDTAEIDGILAKLSGEQQETVELPSDGEPVISQVGDLWQVGGHRLICGDARDPAVHARLLKDQKAQMAFLDPPYNVEVGGNVAGIRKAVHREFAMASGEMSADEYGTFLEETIRNVAKGCLPGAIIFTCIDWRHLEDVIIASRSARLEQKQLIIWHKTNAGMGSFYRSQHELIPVFKVPGGDHVNNIGFGGRGQLRSNVWTYAGANGFRKGRSEDLADHPTVKPTTLVADAIKDCSKRNAIIFDCFAGSGTTLVAAERTGRRGYGVEIDPAFVDVAIRRLERETGCEAKLEDGLTFSAAATVRLREEAA